MTNHLPAQSHSRASGLALVATLALWGVLCYDGPTWCGLNPAWQVGGRLLGWVFFGIATIGVFIEWSQWRPTMSLIRWGLGILLAAGIFWLNVQASWKVWDLLLIGFGGSLLFFGISSLFRPVEPLEPPAPAARPVSGALHREAGQSMIEYVLLVAALAIIIMLVLVFGQQFAQDVHLMIEGL